VAGDALVVIPVAPGTNKQTKIKPAINDRSRCGSFLLAALFFAFCIEPYPPNMVKVAYPVWVSVFVGTVHRVRD
jgi:hypothetical protein